MTLSSDEHQRWYRRIHDILRDVNTGYITSTLDVGYQLGLVRRDMVAVGHSTKDYKAIKTAVFKKEMVNARAQKLMAAHLKDD
jgi:hydroxymethylpyrimidine pyrophosphatase-like HAD family hydrolase